ncbi:hypothetical protein ACFU9F_02605 [Streptomyces zhihengii]|uniref:SnoaL-like domain-containing protein n=1 Tax=Streptomyces zhihengii TaxID=1818004 RepID=A0ABS2UMM1_9ACTN|nr:hypothetical protein [Streptomyces zhihengii]MBM9618132.1 hypothetical protein [Streptomyces zhihengii]
MTGRTALAARTALVLAVLFCAFAGWSYSQTRADDSLSFAEARDDALADGKRRVAELTSFDAGSPDASRTTWLDAATGPLREDLARSRGATDTTARARVTEAALTALDDRTGTAELIATVEVVTTPPGAEPHTERKRLDATLARTADGWKIRSLAAVPVGGA